MNNNTLLILFSTLLLTPNATTSTAVPDFLERCHRAALANRDDLYFPSPEELRAHREAFLHAQAAAAERLREEAMRTQAAATSHRKRAADAMAPTGLDESMDSMSLASGSDGSAAPPARRPRYAVVIVSYRAPAMKRATA